MGTYRLLEDQKVTFIIQQYKIRFLARASIRVRVRVRHVVNRV